MKEFSIEEKAQAYDEAIAYAKKLLKTIGNATLGNLVLKNEFKNMFPALKESEDEKISRFLLESFKSLSKACPNGYYRDDITYKDIVTWLEKQGKQKPIFEMKTLEESLGISSEEYNDIVDECLYGESKSADKVEPKFHKGEWITNGACIIQITSVDDKYYWHDKDCVGGDIESIDKEYHLWTIQDAKDGDVLAVNNEVFIYAHRKQMYSIAVAQCFVDSASGFYLDGEFGYIEKGNSIHPATKEQRDTLMKAMADAGYTFDFEKKELKKIEQKSAKWNEDDERTLNSIIWHLRYSVNNGDIEHSADQLEYWLKSFKDRYTLKPSEEQIKVCKEVYADILSAKGFDLGTINSELNRLEEELKKLKEE